MRAFGARVESLQVERKATAGDFAKADQEDGSIAEEDGRRPEQRRHER